MRLVPVDSLKPTQRLRWPLYHTGGELLHASGQTLTETNVVLLKAAGIKEVVEIEPGDDLKRFQFDAAYDPLPLDNVPTDAPLPLGIYDPDGRLLLKAGRALSWARRDQLAWRGLSTLFVPRPEAERGAERVQAYRDAADVCAVADDDAQLREDHLVVSPEELSPSRLDAWRDTRIARTRPRIVALPGWPAGHERPVPRTIAYVRTFTETMGSVEGVFQDLSRGAGADGKRVASISGRVIRSVLKDPQLSANLLHFKGDGEYLISHSTRVSFLAVAIGSTLGYREEDLVELAYGAFLMDIGMTQVPQAILAKPGALTAEERAEVERHPVLGLSLLERVQSLPRTAALVAYQSHERCDGSGYPHGRTDALIHEHAKIVAIADTFDALTCERPYRAGVLPYKAMEEVIFQAGKKKVAGDLVRAFLNAVSLFPIGSWIELSDGRLGRVVSANGPDYNRPLLRLWLDGGGLSDWLDLRSKPDLKVVRAIPPPPGAGSLLAGF